MNIICAKYVGIDGQVEEEIPVVYVDGYKKNNIKTKQ